MAKKILVVVDAQNDFITGALGNKECDVATNVIADEIRSGKYDDVIFTRDTHDENYLNTQEGRKADTYFILADFKSYAEAQKKVEAAYRDSEGWAKMALLNTASAGKFSSDRTIQQYVDEIWHLDKVVLK